MNEKGNISGTMSAVEFCAKEVAYYIHMYPQVQDKLDMLRSFKDHDKSYKKQPFGWYRKFEKKRF